MFKGSLLNDFPPQNNGMIPTKERTFNRLVSPLTFPTHVHNKKSSSVHPKVRYLFFPMWCMGAQAILQKMPKDFGRGLFIYLIGLRPILTNMRSIIYGKHSHPTGGHRPVCILSNAMGHNDCDRTRPVYRA